MQALAHPAPPRVGLRVLQLHPLAAAPYPLAAPMSLRRLTGVIHIDWQVRCDVGGCEHTAGKSQPYHAGQPVPDIQQWLTYLRKDHDWQIDPIRTRCSHHRSAQLALGESSDG